MQRLACIHQVLGDREKDLERSKNAGVCIELAKSDMFWDIARLINDKVISMNDLEEFSDD